MNGMERFKYQTDRDEDISLHDCRATRIEANGNTFSFVFEDGFWVINDDSFGDGRLHRSGPSVMEVSLNEDAWSENAEIYVFYKRKRKTIRRKMPLDRFVSLIASDRAELEFLYLYESKEFRSYLFDCRLWQKRALPKECTIRVNANGLTFFWNEVQKDRVW